MDKDFKTQLKESFKALNALQIEYHKNVLKQNKTFIQWIMFLNKSNEINKLFGN